MALPNTASPRYLSRPLSWALLSSNSKVVILEGARAVGKTALAKNEVQSQGFSYQDLSDQTTYQRALSDTEGWADSLDLPAIIDEAQRIKELPLVIKRVVDSSTRENPIFILTGSASIGRAGLDGQNPLTRRSQRYTLSPLTQSEIRGNKHNIVDDLFDAAPNPRFRSSLSREDLGLMMGMGGFPQYAIPTRVVSESERSLMIRSDIDDVLGDTLLTDERLDKGIAQKILASILGNPGEILNMSSIASDLEFDKRTVERYVSIFMRRFLLFSLPNLQARPAKQPFTRAKMHPVDTSFTVETLRAAGRDLQDPVLMGGVFESFVADQVVPAVQWSGQRTGCFYWREKGNRPQEVDLVLRRDEGLVGVEVKLATKVDSRDFRGLRALAKDKRFRRGFVVYMGDQFIQQDENLWAMPVTALWEDDAFLRQVEKRLDNHTTVYGGGQLSSEPGVSPQLSKKAKGELPVDANLFLSYCHADNDYLDGAIVAFARKVVEGYEYTYGATLNLFVDVDSINWGDEWKAVIEQRIDSTNFLMPVVTPRYLRSDACRAELLRFYSQMGAGDGRRVLSLIWQDYSAVSCEMTGDQVLAIIESHQHRDVSALQFESARSPEYRKSVQEIVSSLRSVIEERAKQAATVADQGATESNDPAGLSEGLVEKLAQASEQMPQFQASAEELAKHFKELGTVFDRNQVPRGGSSASYLEWATRLSSAANPYAGLLEEDVRRISQAWESIYKLFDSYATMASALPDGSDKTSALVSIEAMISSMLMSTTIPQDAQQAKALVSVLRMLSPKFAPISQAVGSSIDLFESIQSMLRALLERVRLAER